MELDFDHVYIITSLNQTAFSIEKSFFETIRRKSSIINLSDQKIENRLTTTINKHFTSLSQLTLERFNWTYYIEKYNESSRLKSKTMAWDHWKRYGQKDHRNPIDQKTISDTIDVNKIICLIEIFINAIENKYNKIFIINTLATDSKNTQINFPNFTNIFNEYKDIVQGKDLCIFSCMQINYAYLMTTNVCRQLLYELSLFVYRFDDIMKLYINSNSEKYQIFNHSNNSTYIDGNILNGIESLTKLNIDGDLIYKSLNQIKIQQCRSEFNELIKIEKLTPMQINCLNQLVCKFPYEKFRIVSNNVSTLSFMNYLKLCVSLFSYKFWEFINFKSSASPEPIADFSTVYFDHDFYLKVYPCYKNIFRTAQESYLHYTNHGKVEKLLPNETLFELMKLSQKYYCHQYLNKYETNVFRSLESGSGSGSGSDQSLILYDYRENKYLTNEKPIIYILTRTSEREELFSQCCQSIIEQLFVNVRHIVSYDNESTRQYVRRQTQIYKTIDLITKSESLHPNQYIDCFYEILESYEPGWILVLDDDDKFMTSTALYGLEKYTKDPDSLIIWMLNRPDKFIYPIDKNNPVIGEIGSCCYLYHTSKMKKGIWGGNGVGDFRFFKHLFNSTPITHHIYLDYPLTGINYSNKTSGWSAL
jgi:hypothetical protein